MNENDLREALRAKAEEFHMSPLMPEFIRAASRKRLVSSLSRISLLVFAVAALVSVVRAPVPSRDHDGHGVPIAVELIDDFITVRGETSGRIPSREAVEEHVACMREHGFRLPDPVRTEHGWVINVEDPEALGIGSAEWREAAFVTCAPPPPPGPGDLIMPGVAAERIGQFTECMRVQGFDLPPAKPTATGWRFDLSAPSSTFEDPKWKRAVFVTCSVE